MSIHKYQSLKGTTYFVKIYLGLNDYGKKKYYTKRGFKTRKAAKAHEAAVNHQLNSGTFVQLFQKTTHTYQELYDKWYQAYQDTVEASTAAKTADLYRLHILPIFGDKKISKISPFDCQTFITDKAKTYKNMKQIKSYTSKIFEFAINMNYIERNPMSKVIIPKIKKTASENYWSVSELQQFLQIILENEPYKHYALFRLLAYSGLRKGELYALRWSDFNPYTQLLTINKSLGRIDGHAVEKDTKNSFSVRSIYLDDETCTILHKWKQESIQEKGQLHITSLSIEKDFMFTYCSRTGDIEPLHADYINNILKRITRQYKLKKISQHGFRHTHATLMIEMGVDPVNAAKRLGHASSQMTLDTYSHTTKAGEKQAITRFAEYLNKAN
ncbi:site-specific integrase [Streptococcus halichoeri]|uniref:site-specific integrase n=1 Tax=Streptococcus halichoeri TaxID=254785 RepID=UPI00135C6F31|nr:site-specific integrase [Streptococcus halichoeri]